MSAMRIGVGVLVWNQDKTKILTVTNRRWGKFSCPGGKVELDANGNPVETLKEAAIRELEEETGLKALEMEFVAAFAHDTPPKDSDSRQWLCHYFEAQVGDQKPRKNEVGTEISWHTPAEMLTDSLYPDFYKKMFKFMSLI